MKLKEICEYISDRVAVTAVSEANYISTENMAQNKGGVTKSSSIPSSGAVIRYKNDDILISNIRPYFKKIWQADKTGGCSADVLCIRAKKHIDSTFLYYLLSQDAFFEYVMTGAKGCKMPRGDKGHIMDWEIDIPEDKSEQTAIGQCLKMLDKKIEINKQINDNLEQQAQALYKSWFLDFEPFKDGNFVESELGLIPEGWEVRDIYKYTDVIYGAPYKSSLFNENKEGYPLIRIRDLKSFAPQFYTQEILPQTEYIIAGDVVAGMDAEFTPYIWQGEKGVLNQRCCKFKGQYPWVSNYYLLNLLKPELEYVQSYKTGTTVSHLGKADIDRFKVITPPESIVKAFSVIVNSLLEQKIKSAYEIRNLTSTRDSLLPKLMSGELKINEIDC